MGDTWLDKYRTEGLGNSIVIKRSKIADLIISEGINSKDLSVGRLDSEKVFESQKGNFTHRQDTLKYKVERTHNKTGIVPKQRERFYKEQFGTKSSTIL